MKACSGGTTFCTFWGYHLEAILGENENIFILFYYFYMVVILKSRILLLLFIYGHNLLKRGTIMTKSGHANGLK